MQHLHKSTHTHWLLPELVSRLSQSDRRSYLLRGNQISCSPSFLSSLWVIPSSGRPLSCLSPRLHLPQSPEWPQVSFLPFFPRLSLPVFVAVCLSRIYSPDGENSQAVFIDLVKIWKTQRAVTRVLQLWSILINFMNKIMQYLWSLMEGKISRQCQYNGNPFGVQ